MDYFDGFLVSWYIVGILSVLVGAYRDYKNKFKQTPLRFFKWFLFSLLGWILVLILILVGIEEEKYKKLMEGK